MTMSCLWTPDSIFEQISDFHKYRYEIKALRSVSKAIFGKFVQSAKIILQRKAKCSLVQALRLCTGRTAHRGRKSIALPFLVHGTRRGEGSASRPGRSLPRERPGTHCTGGWMGPRADLDRCGKSRLDKDSIPGPSTP